MFMAGFSVSRLGSGYAGKRPMRAVRGPPCQDTDVGYILAHSALLNGRGSRRVHCDRTRQRTGRVAKG